MLQQAAVVDYFQSKVRQRTKFYINSGVFIFDQAGLVINFYLVTVVDLVQAIGQFDQVKTVIDGVAIEDSRKGLGDHTLYACSPNRPDGVLPARAASEILTGYDYVTIADLFHETGVQVLEAIFGQFFLVIGIKIPSRYDLISIYVVFFIYMCF